MKITAVYIIAGLACALMLVAGCTSTPGTVPATTAAPTTAATTVATAPATPVATVTTAPNLTWTGTWNTTYSDNKENWSAKMFLKQTDSSVLGTYEIGNDTLRGTVTGNKLAGTWEETNGTQKINGTFEFVMSADKNSFTGKWANTPQELPNSTEFWNGVRV